MSKYFNINICTGPIKTHVIISIGAKKNLRFFKIFLNCFKFKKFRIPKSVLD